MTNDFTEQSFSEKSSEINGKCHYFENEQNKYFERLKKTNKKVHSRTMNERNEKTERVNL